MSKTKILMNKINKALYSEFYLNSYKGIFLTILTLILLGICYFGIIYLISISFLSIYK